MNHPKAPTLQFGSEPVQNNKSSADVERLLAVNASLSSSIEIPSIMNTPQVSEKLVVALKSRNQTDNVTNPSSSTVHEKLPVETSHQQVEKLTKNITKENLSITSSSKDENLKIIRSDSPLPKKMKMDDSKTKTKTIDKKSEADNSIARNKSVGSTNPNTSSANEPVTGDGAVGRNSLWPEEDGDVDLMLQDFVDEV